MSKAKTQNEQERKKATIAQVFNEEAINRLQNKLDEFQRDYDRKIEKYSVVMLDAPSGTGKTTIAVMRALIMLRSGEIDRIHYVRFPDQRGEKLGFTKGDTDEKEAKYMRPFFDAMNECGIPAATVEFLKAREIIDYGTDIGLRGGNLKGTFLIVDEAQNAQEISDLHLVLTRLHERRGKGAVIGHSKQKDSKVTLYTRHKLTAYQIFFYHMLKAKKWCIKATLVNNYRGKISLHADQVWDTLEELEAMDVVPNPTA